MQWYLTGLLFLVFDVQEPVRPSSRRWQKGDAVAERRVAAHCWLETGTPSGRTSHATAVANLPVSLSGNN